MTVIAFFGAALFGGLFHPGQLDVRHYRQDGWDLVIQRDKFSGETVCTLEKHSRWTPTIAVVPGAMEFRFGHAVDTSEAWYQIDGKPARPARNLQSTLIQIGAFSQAERLDNPAGGVVTLPLSEMTDGTSVEIRPEVSTSPRRFRIRSVWRILASAHGQGCRF